MTPAEEDLAFDLAHVPGGASPDKARARFLEYYRTDDGSQVGLRLLREARAGRDADQVEAALIVGFSFGLTPEYVDEAVALCREDWHHSHDDLVRVVEHLADPSAVDALFHLTQWVPDYLEFDENRALAVHAVWALSKIGTDESREALKRVRDDTVSPVVLDTAQARLEDLESSP